MKSIINNSNDSKLISNGNTLSNASNLHTIQGTDTLIQLRSGMRLMTFCCFLVTFILSIILSSVYFMIQINGALKVFNDIEDNWNNNFILDITEISDTSQCSSPLISYDFPGAKSGCFCEDCREGSSDEEYEFQIKALLDNAYNDKNGSYDESYILDDRMLGSTDESYEDYDSDDFDEILNYKIISKDCDDVKTIDTSDYYQQIAEVPSKTIQSLLADDDKTEINLCIQRSQTHNFLNSYFTEEQTQCEENQILCKGTDDSDKSFWFCGSASEKCPIRKISIIASDKVASTTETYEEELKLSNGYSVLISRFVSDIMPISEFKLFEGSGPCIDAKKVWGLSSKTLIVNPLVKIKQSKICKRDTRFIKSDLEMPQKQFYQHFGVLHMMRAANYPLFFLPQESVALDLFSRSYISFAITCRDILDDVIDLGNTIERLKKIAIVLIVFSSLLSIILLIDVGYILKSLYKINKKKPGDEAISYPWRFSQNLVLSIIYSCLKYPVALCLCTLDCVFFYRLINTREIGEEIIIRHCTDKISSDQFHVVRSHLSFYGIFFHLIVCLGYWSSDIHLINFWRQYCLMKKTKMTPFDEFFALAFVDDDEDDEIKRDIHGKQQRNEESSAGDSIHQEHQQGEIKLQKEEMSKNEESKGQFTAGQKILAKETIVNEESWRKQLSLQQPPLMLNQQNKGNVQDVLGDTVSKRKVSENIQGSNPIKTTLILKEENQEDDDEIILERVPQKKSAEMMQVIPEIIEQQQQIINLTSSSEIPPKQDEEVVAAKIAEEKHFDSLNIDIPKLKKASVSVPLCKQEQFNIQLDSPLFVKHSRRHSTPMEYLLESPGKLPIIVQDFEEDQQQTSNSFIKSSKISPEKKDVFFAEKERRLGRKIKTSESIDAQKELPKQDDFQLESLRKMSGENSASQNILFNAEKSNLSSQKQQNTSKSQLNQVLRLQSSRDSSRTDYQTVSEGENIQGESLASKGIQKNKQLELINFDNEEDKEDSNEQDNKILEQSSSR